MIANWRPVEADKAKLIMTRISGYFPTWTIAADGDSKPRNLADVFSNIGLQTINPANYQRLNKIRPVWGNPLTYSRYEELELEANLGSLTVRLDNFESFGTVVENSLVHIFFFILLFFFIFMEIVK